MWHARIDLVRNNRALGHFITAYQCMDITTNGRGKAATTTVMRSRPSSIPGPKNRAAPGRWLNKMSGSDTLKYLSPPGRGWERGAICSM